MQLILKLSYILYLTLLAMSKESTWLNAIGFTSWSVVVLAWPSCKYLIASSTMESSSAKCLFSFCIKAEPSLKDLSDFLAWCVGSTRLPNGNVT